MTDSRQPAATLTVSRGPGAGRSFDIGAAPVTIGRQAQCDIPIRDTWMSRRHARIAWTGTDYIVEDLGSTNGTFVNGERVVGPRALRTGDRLQLGDQVELAFNAKAPSPMRREPVPPSVAPFPASSAGRARDQAPLPTAKQRRPWVWALAGVGLILVLVAAGVTYYLLADRDQPEGDTPTAQAAAPEPTTATPMPTPVPSTATATPVPSTATATPVPSTATPTPSVIISLGPGRFGKPLWLEVIKGDYKLVNGANLRTGSAISVYEDWLTFPRGLAIDVKEGEITLKGTSYPPGTELVVGSQGSLVER